MISLNLTGRLTRDPELRRVADTFNGQPLDVCHVRVAARDRRGETVYLDLSEWGASGRAAAKYLAKGSMIGFSGELRFAETVDGGGTRQFLSAVGHIEFLDGRGANEQRTGGDTAGVVAPGSDASEIPF